jgi:putative lipoprotein
MRDDLPAFPADSRMRWRLLDVVLTITTLVACSAPPRDVRGGLYVFGHEVESLHLCNDTSAYWLLAPPSVSRLLRARHDSLTDKPYRPVFVEVRGQVSTKPTDGFAEDYDGYFEIDTVFSIRAARSDDCRMAEFPP